MLTALLTVVFCRCIVCRLGRGTRVRVQHFCKDCKIFLCLGGNRNCFDFYHKSNSDLAKKFRLEVDRLRGERPDDSIFILPSDSKRSV